MKGINMAEPAAVSTLHQNKQARNTTFVYGKIVAVRKLKNIYRTLLRLPAQDDDEFSQTPHVEVISTQPLGKPNEIFQGDCRLNGYRRRVTPRPDPETGEVAPPYYTADMTLSLLED
jgi:hypothetical protein